MKGHRTEKVFENIHYKLERIRKALHIVHQSEGIVPDVDKIEAVIYAMASKFLTPKELDQIKEEIKMTELGALIYNDGIADGITQGIEQEALENAKNFFLNGGSYELVRKSIKNISDEVLQKIYDEVMESKKA